MIITSLNKIKLDKIIKEEDIALIESAECYYNEIKSRADALYENTKLEIEELKQNTYNDTVNKLMQENAQALDEFKINLSSFLNNTVEDIYAIIYKVLTKFGVDNINEDNIKSILKEELHSVNINQVLRVVANNFVLSNLQQNAQLEKLVDKIVWEDDNSLNNYECICSTNLWTMRVSLNQALKLITNELN